MPEFEYRGYRVRTLFDKTWQVKVWPPLLPAKLAERIRASRAEGEDACRLRATAVIDSVVQRKASEEKPAAQPG
ncbi:hypothetical protein [Pelagibacterium limicola]|uniref:hypothetical protein n=1 Tax=Pelagibacterium limicola TaxID=2791022 RepID=UPI0018B01603|nr:hypothetical protein [Pelagibacterium limicola]